MWRFLSGIAFAALIGFIPALPAQASAEADSTVGISSLGETEGAEEGSTGGNELWLKKLTARDPEKLSAEEATPSSSDLVRRAAMANTSRVAPKCSGGLCTVRFTAEQALARIEKLILEKRYDDAEQIVGVLAAAPDMTLQYRYFKGHIAAAKGDHTTAEAMFREILRDEPGQASVRLELARSLIAMGRPDAAAYHLKLAQLDDEMPGAIRQSVRETIDQLEDRQRLYFNVDVGIAPDTNITGGTDAEQVDVNFGPFRLPLTLDAEARQRSGIGQTFGASAGARVAIGEEANIAFDVQGRMYNYEGTEADDIQFGVSVGPELRLGDSDHLSVRATAAQRWYGGQPVLRNYGASASWNHRLGSAGLTNFRLDTSKIDNLLNDQQDGWSYGVSLGFEKGVTKSITGSISLFARNYDLEAKHYSNYVVGLGAGLNAELPYGINASLNAGMAKAEYGAPQYIFSEDSRSDTRRWASLTLGNRGFSVLGLSPALELQHSNTDSNYRLYDSDKTRLVFKLARYF